MTSKDYIEFLGLDNSEYISEYNNFLDEALRSLKPSNPIDRLEILAKYSKYSLLISRRSNANLFDYLLENHLEFLIEQ